MSKRLDLVGQKFGRLTVIKYLYTRGGQDRHSHWECICICGKIITAIGEDLKRGRTKSCGCLRSQRMKTINTTHNHSRKRFYIIWLNMKQRCCNPNNKDYKNYGGRGITIHERWKNSFENFWEDVHIGYSDSLQIDRINNDGNYEPGNVRWVTPKENSNNTRKQHKHDSPKITATPQLFIP